MTTRRAALLCFTKQCATALRRHIDSELSERLVAYSSFEPEVTAAAMRTNDRFVEASRKNRFCFYPGLEHRLRILAHAGWAARRKSRRALGPEHAVF